MEPGSATSIVPTPVNAQKRKVVRGFMACDLSVAYFPNPMGEKRLPIRYYSRNGIEAFPEVKREAQGQRLVDRPCGGTPPFGNRYCSQDMRLVECDAESKARSFDSRQ